MLSKSYRNLPEAVLSRSHSRTNPEHSYLPWTPTLPPSCVALLCPRGASCHGWRHRASVRSNEGWITAIRWPPIGSPLPTAARERCITLLCFPKSCSCAVHAMSPAALLRRTRLISQDTPRYSCKDGMAQLQSGFLPSLHCSPSCPHCSPLILTLAHRKVSHEVCGIESVFGAMKHHAEPHIALHDAHASGVVVFCTDSCASVVPRLAPEPLVKAQLSPLAPGDHACDVEDAS